MIIDSVKDGPAPTILNPAPQKPCRACANENLSKICVDKSQAKATGACCV